MRKGDLEEVKEGLSDLEEIKEGLSEYFRLRPWGDQGDTSGLGLFTHLCQTYSFCLTFRIWPFWGPWGRG